MKFRNSSMEKSQNWLYLFSSLVLTILFSCAMNPKSIYSTDYTKKIVKITMRDGIELNTEVYTPNYSG